MICIFVLCTEAKKEYFTFIFSTNLFIPCIWKEMHVWLCREPLTTDFALCAENSISLLFICSHQCGIRTMLNILFIFNAQLRIFVECSKVSKRHWSLHTLAHFLSFEEDSRNLSQQGRQIDLLTLLVWIPTKITNTKRGLEGITFWMQSCEMPQIWRIYPMFVLFISNKKRKVFCVSYFQRYGILME